MHRWLVLTEVAGPALLINGADIRSAIREGGETSIKVDGSEYDIYYVKETPQQIGAVLGAFSFYKEEE